MVSYFLDQANAGAGLSDGVNYARIDIDDNTANQIRFSVTLLNPVTQYQATNFGLQEFTFNVVGAGAGPLTDATGSNAQWTLPSGWVADVAPPPNQADGFGRFDVSINTTGSGRLSPLTFALLGSGLTLASFQEASTNGNGEGNVFFAAHITGYNVPANGATSGYFGGSTLSAVPLPAALPLLLSGMLGFGAAGYRTRRKR
jgi:hypothetical protein